VVSAWHGRCFTLPGGSWPRLFPGRSVGFLGLPGQSCRANASVPRPVELFGQLLGEEISVHPGLPALRQIGRSGVSLQSWPLSCNTMRAYLLITQDAAPGFGQAATRALERSVGFLGLLRERPVSVFGRLPRRSVDFLGLAETDRAAPRQLVRSHSFWRALAKLSVLDSLASSFADCARCCHLRPCLASFSVAAGNWSGDWLSTRAPR
jgi:hypothetical protein